MLTYDLKKDALYLICSNNESKWNATHNGVFWEQDNGSYFLRKEQLNTLKGIFLNLWRLSFTSMILKIKKYTIVA